MPMLEHIDVRVLVNDHPLQEYADPEGDPDDSHSRVRYIESVVGQKFRVVVRLLPNFQLKNAPWFRSGFYIDNSTTEHYAFIGQEYLRHRKGCLQTSCDLSNKAHFAVWNDALGRLEDCAFEFGALGSSEDGLDSTEQPVQNIPHIGSIRVKVFRARRRPRDQPYTWDGKVVKPVDELPEKMLKGRDIKANTKYAPIGKSSTQVTEYHEYIPVDGPAGKPYEFIFKYRTRRALQNLGCIERSPTPEPDPQVKLARAEDMNQRLLDELALLKKGGIKTETSTTIHGRSATPQVKSEAPFVNDNPSPATSRKRQRGPFEDDNDVVETAPPPKAPRIEIDLTGDDD